MTALHREAGYLGRYAGSGALNTIAGFATIFALMELGISPFIANVSGYLVGLVLGFFVSRKFVFVSQGHLTAEVLRYLGAFAASLFLNLLVLRYLLNTLHWNAYVAQLVAAIVYTACMYALTRWLVFTPGVRR